MMYVMMFLSMSKWEYITIICSQSQEPIVLQAVPITFLPKIGRTSNKF
jgi:hypothetical protein